MIDIRMNRKNEMTSSPVVSASSSRSSSPSSSSSSSSSPTKADVGVTAIPTPTTPTGLKVLFLSSDTGGGHRASAESLARQFELLYPGSTYALLDTVEKDGVPPYNSLVGSYKHLSAHPAQWKLVYSVSNSRAFEMIADVHLKLMCERAVRRRISSYDPDVVVSVHPLMTNVPVLACDNLSKQTGKHLPIFTVVTDLGSAHCLWFANGVEKMFIASDQIRALAKSRGKVPDEKLVQVGLPIRHDFAIQAEKLGDRTSAEGKAYQRSVREELELPHVDRHTVLVMGGGEGVGSLSNIVDALYVDFTQRGLDAVILVVCGRNERLKNDLAERDWDGVVTNYKARMNNSTSDLALGNCVSNGPIGGCIEGTVASQIRRILSSSSMTQLNAMSPPTHKFMEEDAIDATAFATGGSRSASPAGGLPLTIEDEVHDEEEKKGEEVVSSENGGVAKETTLKSLADSGLTTVEDPTSPAAADAAADAKQDDDGVDTSADNLNDFSIDDATDHTDGPAQQPGQVTVVGLGFVTRMAEYMVAADVLVSKAGPGTIAEAASLSLPVMLTSFLPGQEEGNVDYVVDGQFGAFRSDSDPQSIAEEVSDWLSDDTKMAQLSAAAKAKGAPHAAADIVKAIGDSALKWKSLNEEHRKDKMDATAPAAKGR